MTKDEALDRLKQTLPVGSKIHAIIRSVSSSGMSRRISFLHIDHKTQVITHLDYWLAAIGAGSLKDGKEGILVRGCGMDMAFHVVYNLGHRLHDNGYAFKKEQL